MKFTAKQIAEMTGGRVEGREDAAVSTFAKIEEGQEGALSFLSNPKYTHYIYNTNSSIVLVNDDLVLDHPVQPTLIRVKNAYESVAHLLQLYGQMQPRKKGVDPLAFVSASARLGKDVYVGPFACIGEGVVIMGDGAAYHDVEFNALIFKPEQQEIVVGEVIEIAEFGAFVRIGPMDGLVHVSQITDDYINYDARNSALIGKESNKILQQGDKVRARIVALSLKGKSIRDSKIGLTMRQPHLGSFEWIAAEKRKIAEKKAKS